MARVDSRAAGRPNRAGWSFLIEPIGQIMIYLDNAATSFPKPEAVYQTLDAFARRDLANPGRAGHKMALAAERALDDCRHLLNQFFHGEGPERFIFTLNCTDALNMAFKGVLKDGDHVITTDLEHNSVSRPLRAMELAGKITLTRIAADQGGTADPDAIKRTITPKTRLIAMTHCSNVLGTVQPIRDVGAIARKQEILFLVDAAQTAGVIPIDVQTMCIDLLALPGHKSLLGPTGTGVLYVGPGAVVGAWREGGTGGDSSSETQPRDYPYFLEGGTPSVLGVAGLAAGIKYVAEQGLATYLMPAARPATPDIRRSAPARQRATMIAARLRQPTTNSSETQPRDYPYFLEGGTPNVLGVADLARRHQICRRAHSAFRPEEVGIITHSPASAPGVNGTGDYQAKHSRAIIPTSSVDDQCSARRRSRRRHQILASPSKAWRKSISTRSSWSNACGSAWTRSAATRCSAIAT